MGKRKEPPQETSQQQQEPRLLPQVQKRQISFPCGSSFSVVQKRFYRQRAHANPFSDHALSYPSCPEEFDIDKLYPAFSGSGKYPEFADVGCGFGGLLVALAPMFPDSLILGEYPPQTYNLKNA